MPQPESHPHFKSFNRTMRAALCFPAIGISCCLSFLLLVSCSEIVDEPLSRWKSYALLTGAVGFSPQSAKLLYSWRHCCRASDPFGGWPGSWCVVYLLKDREFDRVRTTSYEKFRWTADQTQCEGPSRIVRRGPSRKDATVETMKGCSEFSDKKFFTNGAKFELHGETCFSNTGVILKIDSKNRAVMVERYFYE